MSWEAVGAIGEIVGAAGVIVTLVYLAIQIRQNTRSLRATAVWDSQMSFVAINETLADGGKTSQVMYRAISDPGDLDDFEKHLVHRYLRGFFQRMEAQFALYSSGVLPPELWELRCGYARGLLNRPLVKAVWELDKGNMMFTRGFIEAMESGPRAELAGFLGIENRESGA